MLLYDVPDVLFNIQTPDNPLLCLSKADQMLPSSKSRSYTRVQEGVLV